MGLLAGQPCPGECRPSRGDATLPQLGGPLPLSPHQGSSVRLVLCSRRSAGCSVRSPLTISPCGNAPVSLLSLTFYQARASYEAPVVSGTSAFGFCLLGAHGSLVGCAHSCFVVSYTPNPFFPVHGCTCHSRDRVMLLQEESRVCCTVLNAKLLAHFGALLGAEVTCGASRASLDTPVVTGVSMVG